ncbi:hypothetical protein J1N35_016674 [Gossypium stocksii]|uniref:Uncharacterized protein n=1 Tax=Gossypium stocksii TaxID=47602 RepID=A0A9D3VLR4_9ROSI|nr:hypothetical protein J1N35_016674 [Gossypium stocksii]
MSVVSIIGFVPNDTNGSWVRVLAAVTGSTGRKERRGGKEERDNGEGLGHLTDATLRFGMLPKGVPIPPSGPSRRTSDSPPPPPPPPLTSTSLSILKSLNFGMQPKGPPSPGRI